MRGTVAALISEKQISDKRCLSSSSVTVPYCGFTCPCVPRVILVLHCGADFQLRDGIRPRRVGSVNWVGSREEAGRRYEPESLSCSTGFCTVRCFNCYRCPSKRVGEGASVIILSPFSTSIWPRGLRCKLSSRQVHSGCAQWRDNSYLLFDTVVVYLTSRK